MARARRAGGSAAARVWAALGVTIERGEEHNELWRHLGIERPTAWAASSSYELDDLYPDAIACLEAAARARACASASSATRPALDGAVGARARRSRPTSSLVRQPRRQKPDPRFFARVVELAGCAPAEVAYVGDRVDNDVLPGRGGGARRRPRPARAVGEAAATPPEAAFGVDDLAALPDALASLP